MLNQCRTRWPNIKTALDQCIDICRHGKHPMEQPHPPPAICQWVSCLHLPRYNPLTVTVYLPSFIHILPYKNSAANNPLNPHDATKHLLSL